VFGFGGKKFIALVVIGLLSCAFSSRGRADGSFPTSDYTPYGYLDNPLHSLILHPSGVIRSVAPLGFGFWMRRMPWPYGDGALRTVNYLSILDVAISVDGARFHTTEDFSDRHIDLVSRYHTKEVMSYDWDYAGLSFSVRYVYSTGDALIGVIHVHNSGVQKRTVTVHATNIYGFPEVGWWGSDGVAAHFNANDGVALSKLWAYGDIFALGASERTVAAKATSSKADWLQWIDANDLSINEGAMVRFPTLTASEHSSDTTRNSVDALLVVPEPPTALYTLQTYRLTVPPTGDKEMTLVLARGVNEGATLKTLHAALDSAAGEIEHKLSVDSAFYGHVPVLTGNWSPAWKHGWIYDLETLRMNVRPPMGIYKHSWDGMQVFSPRVVLGESSLDAMALSYADMALAKEVILGTFADAPAPNVPCSREDGSMNMICADGSEVGTAPTWGMPFHVIRSMYSRDPDSEWISALYPHLKAFLEWWLANRTDKDGWFHSKCSWESGQDGSKRFLVPGNDPAAVSDYVRTVDIEAAMAEAFENMILFAEVSGHTQDIPRWQQLAEQRRNRTRTMYVDGWFRDFDGRTGRPIVLKDYYDVMMLFPLASGIATQDQMMAIAPHFEYFAKNPTFWLEWPSFMFPFTEAGWTSGLREFIGGVVADTGSRIYPRLDTHHVTPIEADRLSPSLPPQYEYRIPGVSNEFWPIRDDVPAGGENYGWGATLPTLVIRNVIGFREPADPTANHYTLAPALPKAWLIRDRAYGITNLSFHGVRTDVEYRIVDNHNLRTKLTFHGLPGGASIMDADGKVIATIRAGETSTEFTAQNGALYRVSLH
jgi:hypothetical protein